MILLYPWIKRLHHACLFLYEDYNDYSIEKANPPRGGDAKSWISQHGSHRLEDRQTAEVFVRWSVFLKEVARQILSVISLFLLLIKLIRRIISCVRKCYLLFFQ